MSVDGVRLRFAAWLVAAALLGAFFVLRVQPGLRVETDIMALLPAAERDADLDRRIKLFATRLGRGLVFLVGARDFEVAAAAARGFGDALRAAPAFGAVRVDLGADVTAAPGWLPWRDSLLAAADYGRLRSGQGALLGQEALERLYAPAAAPRPLPLTEDPLNLAGNFLVEQSAALPGARLRGGLLHVADGERSWIVVLAHTAGDAFSLADQDRVRDAVAAARAAAAAQGAEVLGSGVTLHAIGSSTRARQEMALFGSCSALGVVLLTWLAFASLRPLLLSLGVLGVSVVAGLTACSLLFERLDLLTLVFGTSLTGVAVDYSMHFMADQFRDGDWSGRDALGHVGAAILTSHACAVLGYLALALTPFPGLQQMAAFSIAGLVCACATVLCVYPVLARRGRAGPSPLLGLARRLGRATPVTAAQKWVAVGLGLLVLAGASRVQWQDDVRLLSSSPDSVRAEEAALRERLGHASESRFFLVSGASPEEVLQREEALRARLDALVGERALVGYRALTQALPSLQRQQEHRALVAAAYAPAGPAARVLAKVGLPPKIAAVLQVRAQHAPGLEPAEFFALREAAAWRDLWLEEGPVAPEARSHPRSVATALQLRGVEDPARVAAAAAGLPGVRFVDRLAETSAVLQRYRARATQLMLFAYVLIAGALAVRYGARAAATLILPPLGGAAATLALLGLLGMPANLFNLLALLLVLGMGIDYAVFLREGRSAPLPVLMAILLSTLSALLSFGLLAFSATPFIRSVGLTLAIGISLVFLIALALHRIGAGAEAARAPDDSARGQA
jgi:predicted exporter